MFMLAGALIATGVLHPVSGESPGQVDPTVVAGTVEAAIAQTANALAIEQAVQATINAMSTPAPDEARSPYLDALVGQWRFSTLGLDIIYNFHPGGQLDFLIFVVGAEIGTLNLTSTYTVDADVVVVQLVDLNTAEVQVVGELLGLVAGVPEIGLFMTMLEMPVAMEIVEVTDTTLELDQQGTRYTFERYDPALFTPTPTPPALDGVYGYWIQEIGGVHTGTWRFNRDGTCVQEMLGIEQTGEMDYEGRNLSCAFPGLFGETTVTYELGEIEADTFTAWAEGLMYIFRRVRE